MDRTVWNGTGFAGQYPNEVAATFESIETTPDDLLLWFHHVPYKHVLKNGKTVIQHFYDAHYDGAETAASFPKRWASLKGLIDQQHFEEMLFRLEYQGQSLLDSCILLFGVSRTYLTPQRVYSTLTIPPSS